MRIIAGIKRGMKLLSPKGKVSRPVTDRVKESLFSVLYKYDLPAGKRVADLFCGVGSMGLESLSRAAEFVTFVENDQDIIAILNKNIEKAGFVKQSKVIRADAFKVGPGVNFNDDKYNLVFVDPPFSSTENIGRGSDLDRLLRLLNRQLAPDAIVVVRAHNHTELLEQYGTLETIERRRWGINAVTILKQISK